MRGVLQKVVSLEDLGWKKGICKLQWGKLGMDQRAQGAREAAQLYGARGRV